jgi:ribonuclease HI
VHAAVAAKLAENKAELAAMEDDAKKALKAELSVAEIQRRLAAVVCARLGAKCRLRIVVADGSRAGDAAASAFQVIELRASSNGGAVAVVVAQRSVKCRRHATSYDAEVLAIVEAARSKPFGDSWRGEEVAQPEKLFEELFGAHAGGVAEQLQKNAQAKAKAKDAAAAAAPADSLIVVSDCKGAVTALSRGKFKAQHDLVKMAREELLAAATNVHVLWVPSHVGWPPHDAVDKLAGEARKVASVRETEVFASYSSVRNAIRAVFLERAVEQFNRAMSSTKQLIKLRKNFEHAAWFQARRRVPSA